MSPYEALVEEAGRAIEDVRFWRMEGPAWVGETSVWHFHALFTDEAILGTAVKNGTSEVVLPPELLLKISLLLPPLAVV